MEHDITLQAFEEGCWGATCSCGWIGEEWEDSDDAILDGDNHRDEVGA